MILPLRTWTGQTRHNFFAMPLWAHHGVTGRQQLLHSING